MLLLCYTVIHNSLSPFNGHTVIQSTQKLPNQQVQPDWLALHNAENKGTLETKGNSVAKLKKFVKLVASNL